MENNINLIYLEYNYTKFYICDTLNLFNINKFIMELKDHNIKHLIRLSIPLYDSEYIKAELINFYDYSITDFFYPSTKIIKKTLKLLNKAKIKNENILIHSTNNLKTCSILAGIILINNGMNNTDAIKYLKDNNVSLNLLQKQYLQDYKIKKYNKCWYIF